jgi:7-carboxy-7-deazaguanine synthase
MNNVKLIELITTWQGEGPDSGKVATLARFKRCNRSCAWCDTIVKSRNYIEADFQFNVIQDILDDKMSMLLISGGEPTFSLNLNKSAMLLNDLTYSLSNVETNGLGLLELISKVLPDKNIKYILSPKLFNKIDVDFYYELTGMVKNNRDVFIKLVCEDRNHVTGYLDYLEQIAFPTERVYLMPEGNTKETLIEHSPYVFDMCEKYNFNFSSRDHIIYGFI